MGQGAGARTEKAPHPALPPSFAASRFLPSARTVVFFLNLAWPRVITGTAGRKAGARRLGLPGPALEQGRQGTNCTRQELHQGSHHTSVMRCLQQTFV